MSDAIKNLEEATAALTAAKEAQEEALKTALVNNANKDIAEVIGKSASYISTLRRKYEIPSPKGAGSSGGRRSALVEKASPEAVKLIRDCKLADFDWKEVADALNENGHTLPNGKPFTAIKAETLGLNYGIGARSVEDFLAGHDLS